MPPDSCCPGGYAAMLCRSETAGLRPDFLPEIMMNMENSTAPWCMMASPGHRSYASNSSRPLALGTKQCLVRIPTHRYSRTHQLAATAVPNSPHPGIKIRSTAESDSSRTNSWDLTCGSRWGPWDKYGQVRDVPRKRRPAKNRSAALV